jgi:flagellar L-ring protein FlgH
VRWSRCFWIPVLLVLATGGCAQTRKDAPEIIDLPDPSLHANGSIWREGFGDPYGDRRARRLGDIVTVAIVEEASASNQTSTDTGRSSNLDAAITDLFGMPSNFGMTNFAGMGQAFSPTVSGSYGRQFKGSGSTTRKGTLVATVTARVMEIYPGGNMRIAGQRDVRVNREKQRITVEGVIRPEDISFRNTIPSTLIADANVQYRGRGVLSDTGGPGWLSRILDWIWPI